MPTGHRFLKFARQLHLYLGVFAAPMLLFFAVTGALQTFDLHEPARDGDYRPPAWLASLGMLHKKQTLTVPARRPRPQATAASVVADGTHAGANAAEMSKARTPSAPDETDSRAQAKNPLPMKIFFGLVSLGLLLSTLSGVYMAYRFTRRPVWISALLALGVAVPVLLAAW